MNSGTTEVEGNLYESLVDATGDGIVELDAEGSIVEVSESLCELLERSRSDLVGEPFSEFVEEAGDDAFEELLSSLVGSDETTTGPVRFVLRTPDEPVTVDCWIAVAPESNGTVAVATFRSVSNRGSRQKELAVKARAMDKATIALCLSDPTRPDNPLVWVNEGFEKLTGYDGTDVLGQNCRFLQGAETDPEKVAELRSAVEDERSTSVELLNYRRDGQPFWNLVDIVPIYGDDGELVYFLGSQSDVTSRKEHEIELARQREQLVALNQLNRVIRRINSGLGSMSTREEIEQLVCQALADSDSYTAAWIGEAHRSSGDIRLRASANIDEAFLDRERGADVEPDDGEFDRTPTSEALETRELQVVSDIERSDYDEAWREAALDQGYEAVVAIPVGFQELQYDVLTIYASRERAFSGQEREAIHELEQIVGHAINAIERKEALLNNVVTELEFEIRDGFDVLTQETVESDCEIRFDRTVPTNKGHTVQFIRATGIDTERLQSLVEEIPSVDSVRAVGEDDEECAIEVRRTDPTVTAMFAEYGGYVTDAVISDGEFHVVAELPQETSVREVIEIVQQQYPESELLAQRTTTRNTRTLKQFQSSVNERLTEKQRGALNAAYAAGYFSWPRESTGEEVAEALGISPPTFHQHVRMGLAELLAVALDHPE